MTDQTLYEYLNFPAKLLDTEADSIASQIQTYAQTTSYHLVPLTPECAAHFDIDGKTVTSHLKAKIRKARAYKLLYNYIAETNDFSPSTMQSIDWTLHKRGLQHKYTRRNHYCKLVHDILPTNSLASKYLPYRTPHCPRCQLDLEDRDHILRCPQSD